MADPLARLRTQLDTASSIEDLWRLQGTADVGRRWHDAQGMRDEANRWALAQIGVVRALGEHCLGLKRDPGGRPRKNPSGTHDELSAYAKVRTQYGRDTVLWWQAVAGIGEPAAERYIAEVMADDHTTVTVSGLVAFAKQEIRLGRRMAAEAERAVRFAGADHDAVVIDGDALAFIEAQPPASVDLLFTDPPYLPDVADIDVAVQWLPRALRAVTPTGRALVCIGSYPEELRAYLTLDLGSPWRVVDVLVWTFNNTLGPRLRTRPGLMTHGCAHGRRAWMQSGYGVVRRPNPRQSGSTLAQLNEQ